MSTQISQTAVVDPRAKIGANVSIGHFCVIGPDVEIGDNTRIDSHAVVSGHTTMGEDNQVFPSCVIGTAPQDTSYQDAPTRVSIGNGNVFREQCTVNRGTEKEEGVTRVGDNNYFMTATHIAHDCKVGDRIVIANNCMLGGHVSVGNDVTIAGGVGVNHFASIGQMSFISAMSCVLLDVPPFMIAGGQPARPRAINAIGLKRHEYPSEDIRLLKIAFKRMYRDYVGVESLKQEILTYGPLRPVLKELIDSLERSAQGMHGRGQQQRKKAA